jgi:Hemerythrin HHE cation binding domain
MDALDLLKKDHDRIRKLCTDANTHDDMKRLFDAIRAELEAHSHLEETDFYPQFENRKFLKELIQDAQGATQIDQRPAARHADSRRPRVREKFPDAESRSAAVYHC